ncbi:MAG: DUF1801 domain-containing protein [Alphaproteobacteria bacterium]|nr:DUF1801 domain-containing protein [Alphaproteobacteria bacterium]
MTQHKFADKDVEAVFASYPNGMRDRLLTLRTLIFETAQQTDGVGALEETLKWGQPSYLTVQSKSGSTIRIDQAKVGEGRYAAYFHCQSGLVPLFQEHYGEELCFEGKRAIVFDPDKPLPEEAVRHCIALALTHHLRKKAKKKIRA